MRVGVVGCGQIAEQGHLPALLATAGVELVGFVDTAPARARRLAGLAAAAGHPAGSHDSIADLVRVGRPDLVLLATPPSVRRAELAELAAARVAVLCEKPLANTVEEADHLVAAAQHAGARIFLTHNYAFFAEYELLAELVAQGRIGEVRSVVVSCLGSHGWDGVADFRPGWRLDPGLSGGGRLLDGGVHALYLAAMLAGRGPDEVVAVADFQPAPPFDRECFAIYRHGDVRVSLSIGTGHGPVAFEVRGERGRLHLDYERALGDYSAVPRAVRLYRDGALVESWPVPDRGMITGGLYREIGRRLAEDDDPYLHSVRHGRDLVATVEATYRAAQSGQRVAIATGADRHP